MLESLAFAMEVPGPPPTRLRASTPAGSPWPFRAALLAALALALWALGDGWMHLGWIRQRAFTAGALLVAAVAALACAAALVRGWPAIPGAGERCLEYRLAVVLAGALWITCLLVVDPYREFALQLAAAVAAGAWALLAVEVRRGEWRFPRALSVLERLLFRLVLVLAAVELILAGIARLWPMAALAGGSAEPRALVEANRPPAGSFSFGFPCDQRGHYDAHPGPPPRAGKLVVSIGDSFSASVVPHEFHYTTVAERELAALRGPDAPPVEVYNMGLPGLGPPEYLHLLVHEALPLEPDLIVVHLFAGNDLDSYGLVKPGVLRRWFDRRELHLVRVPLRIERLLAERRAKGKEGAQASAPWHRGAQRRLATREEVVAEYPFVLDPLLESPNYTLESHARTEAYRAHDGCRPGERFEDFFPWIEALVRAAGEIGIVFALIPDEYQLDDDTWQQVQAYVGRTPGMDPPQRLVRDHIQRVLVPAFEQRGWTLLDYLPILRAVPPLADGRLHLYHLRDTHWNARGNQVAGEALARFLHPRLR